MLLNRTSTLDLVALILISMLACAAARCEAQLGKKPFTVTDEIGLTLFGDSGGGRPELHFSPDGNYFAVWTERGLLDLDRVEDSIGFYRSADIDNFLKNTAESQPPSPVWVVTRSDKEGSIIRNWSWLAESSGVVFLEQMAGGGQRLVLADVRKKTTEPLTSEIEMVKAFDVRDRNHYVYTVADPAPLQKMRDERREPMIVGTGRDLSELLFPGDALTLRMTATRSYLWAVVAGKRFQVKHDRTPLVLFGGGFVLSPDGASLVTTLPVSDVPQ